MRKKLIFIIIAVVLIMNVQVVHAQEPIVDASSYLLMDASSGQILYEKNADEKKLFPASTTKIMTAIIALERGRLDQMMIASQAAVNDIGKDGMNIGIMAGEEIPMEDLLNALMVTSANETANIIAENLCSTRQEFVDLMNEKAMELGAVDTHFVNPCGAHDNDHYSTARDMAKIAHYAMTLPKFREIVAQTSYTMPATNKHDTWGTLPVTNKLLFRKSDYYSKVTGIKTGYTDPAGNNLIASAIDDQGMELISVVMGVRTSTATENVFSYSQNLLEYGFRNFSLQRVDEANRPVGTVSVVNAEDDGTLQLVTKNSFECVLPNDPDKWNIEKVEYIEPLIEAPVESGDVVGHIQYKRNDTILGEVQIIASNSIQASKKAQTPGKSNNSFVNSILKKILIFLLSFTAFILILRPILRRISRRVNSKRF